MPTSVHSPRRHVTPAGVGLRRREMSLSNTLPRPPPQPVPPIATTRLPPKTRSKEAAGSLLATRTKKMGSPPPATKSTAHPTPTPVRPVRLSRRSCPPHTPGRGSDLAHVITQQRCGNPSAIRASLALQMCLPGQYLQEQTHSLSFLLPVTFPLIDLICVL